MTKYHKLFLLLSFLAFVVIIISGNVINISWGVKYSLLGNRQITNFSDIKDYSKKITDADKKELFITGVQLKKDKDKLKLLLENNPDLVVVLDVSSGGFVDDKGTFSLSSDYYHLMLQKDIKGDLPGNIRYLKIVGAEKVLSIGDNFLRGAPKLVSLDLSSLSNLTHIGNYVLHTCSSIEYIDLSSSSKLAFIGARFLGLSDKKLKSIKINDGLKSKESYDGLATISPLVSAFLKTDSEVLRKEGFAMFDTFFKNNNRDGGDIEFAKIVNHKEKIKDAYKKAIIISGKDLRKNKEKLELILENNPDILVKLDISSGGFINNNGAISISVDRYDYLDNKSIKGDLPSNVYHLQIVGAEKASMVAKGFLDWHMQLLSADISSLSNINKIADDFMSKNFSLVELSQLPFSKLETIGDNFLGENSFLRKIDLSEFFNVRSIGNYFLARCNGITSIDLSSISRLIHTGYGFMSGCDKVESLKINAKLNSKDVYDGIVPISPLMGALSENIGHNSNIIKEGHKLFNEFFHGFNKSKKEIKLSDISDPFQIIKDSYMKVISVNETELKKHKEKLEKIIMNNPDILLNIYALDGGFIRNGVLVLSYKDLPRGLLHLKITGKASNIGDNFLNSNLNLLSLDLSALDGLRSIGNNFLSGCDRLLALDLSSFAKEDGEIGSGFLNFNRSMILINLPDFVGKPNNEKQKKVIKKIIKGLEETESPIMQKVAKSMIDA